MMKRKPKGKKAVQSTPINVRVLFLLFFVIVCSVFVWMYLNRNVQDTNAASPESRPVITRPVDDPVSR